MKAKPAPPLPPAKRPAAKKPPPAPARDSAVSMTMNGNSGRATPESGKSTPSLAGGLAEALRARQASMQGKPQDDDDW